jgi:hypothetical protein
LLTRVPALDRFRARRARTGGTGSARYCYSVWLRHLVGLRRHGLGAAPWDVAELGPGDSIGIGIAALLSGARRYVGLDVVRYSDRASWGRILDEMIPLFASRAAIPGENEFPEVRPPLPSYDFPDECLPPLDLSAERVRALRGEITDPGSARVRLVCPWFAADQVEPSSIDVMYSQAVLEHVVDLDATYRAMFTWLKPGGYASHVIDFRAHHVSRRWNGHWRFPERLWRLAVGRREFVLNRRPVSYHLACIERAGFELLAKEVTRRHDGLSRRWLARPFRDFSDDDLHTSGAYVVLRKP